jgi:flagellar basal body-associated protein FliL
MKRKMKKYRVRQIFPWYLRNQKNNKKDDKRLSIVISLVSVFISTVALAFSFYFSWQTIKFQSETNANQGEANAIQKQNGELNRNVKIAELITEHDLKKNMNIDFKGPEKVVVEQVTKRSEEILITLNNLFLITRGLPEWDKYIQDSIQWPLGSLLRRKTRVSCKSWSSGFKTIVFDNKWKPVDECLICNDVICPE